MRVFWSLLAALSEADWAKMLQIASIMTRMTDNAFFIESLLMDKSVRGWMVLNIVVPYAGMIRIRFEGMISGHEGHP